MRDAHGRLIKVQSVGRDISERKALEQALTDAKPGDIATVWHRRSGRRWVVVLHAEDFLAVLRASRAGSAA